MCSNCGYEPLDDKEPLLPCGHPVWWETEEGQCGHNTCVLNRAERAEQDSIEAYYGASTPQTLREQMDVESRRNQ